MNSVAHMVNAMNKVLKNCIPEITMPFPDDIPIKGCPDEEKDKSRNEDGCHRSYCGWREGTMRTQRCLTAFGRKPSLTKVDAIQAMKEECTTQMDVQRFSRNMCVLPYLDSTLRSCRGTVRDGFRTDEIVYRIN
jgi:hypothetical protein